METEKKRLGRPPSENPRKVMLWFRVSEAEHQVFLERFKASGCKKPSDYIRRACIGELSTEAETGIR